MYLASKVVTAIGVAPRSGSELSLSPEAKRGRTQPASSRDSPTPACGSPGVLPPATAQPAALAESTASPPPSCDLGGSAPRVAKSGITRSGSALCGVLGFQQHLGLGSAVLGGLGWLIASDHAGFLLRRRYGPRIQAHVRRWQSKSRLPTRLIAPLHARVALPGHLAKTPYRVFALINTIGAVVWGAAFVSAGYVLARLWHSGRPDWTDLAVLLTVAAVSLDLVLRRRLLLIGAATRSGCSMSRSARLGNAEAHHQSSAGVADLHVGPRQPSQLGLELPAPHQSHIVTFAGVQQSHQRPLQGVIADEASARA
jgi:hypothetical protein